MHIQMRALTGLIEVIATDAANHSTLVRAHVWRQESGGWAYLLRVQIGDDTDLDILEGNYLCADRERALRWILPTMTATIEAYLPDLRDVWHCWKESAVQAAFEDDK